MRLVLSLIFIAALGCEHVGDCPDIECPACPEYPKANKCITIDNTVKLCADEDSE